MSANPRQGVEWTSNSKVLLSPSLLRLEIPPETNTSLPVWDAIRSQHVDVTWRVQPDGLSVHLTPKTSVPQHDENCMAMFAGSSKCPSSLPLPPTPDQTSAEPHAITPSNSPVDLNSTKNSQVAPLITPQQTVPQSLPRYRTRSTTKKLPFSIFQTPTSTNMSPFPDPLPFETRSCSDISICDNFLVGACHMGKECLRHHTPFPYHWQLFCMLTQKWVSFPPHSQVLLEREYCKVESNAVYIDDGKNGFTLDFELMEVVTPRSYGSVRRLATLKTDQHFPSKLRIYWMNGSKWRKYDEVMSCLLLDTMDQKKPKVSLLIQSKEHIVDFTNMTQTDVLTNYSREVRCRPVFRSPESMQPHLRTFFFTNPTMPADPSMAYFNVNPLVKFSSWYPPVWVPALDEEFRLIKVPAGTLAHQSIQKFFYQGYLGTKVDVVSIHQIQNLLHWDKYQRHKVHMQKHHKSKTKLEQHLFHGTDKEAAKGICQNNFDRRMYSVNGRVLGKGSYFAPSASTAHHYTLPEDNGVRHMFLAKVLVGRATVGNNLLYHPPALSPSHMHQFFDSCVDNRNMPSMFVVFDSCQCYPYYLIKYKDKK